VSRWHPAPGGFQAVPPTARCHLRPATCSTSRPAARRYLCTLELKGGGEALPLRVSALRLLRHLLGLPARCRAGCGGLPALLEALRRLVADLPASSHELGRWGLRRATRPLQPALRLRQGLAPGPARRASWRCIKLACLCCRRSSRRRATSAASQYAQQLFALVDSAVDAGRAGYGDGCVGALMAARQVLQVRRSSARPAACGW
jgi:hypothetical protein